MHLNTKPAALLGPQLHLGAKPVADGLSPATTHRVHTNGERIARYGRKPYGGFWTSTYLGPDRGSDWVRWCEGESFSLVTRDRWWLLPVATEALVIEVNSWADFDAVEHHYGIPCYPNTPALADSRAWDFERMHNDGYVGVHLTESAATELHWYRDGNFDASLNSWDVESTVWFTWVFGVAERPVFEEAEAA